MKRRLVVVVALAVAMAGSGYLTYSVLGRFKHAEALRQAPHDPAATRTPLVLPGTIYLTHQGDIYALHNGGFTKVATHTAGASWAMPSLDPQGRLLAVLRSDTSSDLYLLDATTGTVLGRLTSDEAGKRYGDNSLEYDRWAFYPRASADGRSLLFSFDSPKCGYRTALAVWSMPLPAAGVTPSPPPAPRATSGCPAPTGPPGARRQTTPNDYTGGDVMPLPVAGGGMLFVRYSFDQQFHVHSAIWYQRSAADAGVAVTDPADDCSQPALAPDGVTLAMVCTHGGPTTSLEVARLTLDASARPGSAREAVLAAARSLPAGALLAMPAWAPDGSGLVYLAPDQSGGPFELWWVGGAAGATPSQALALTDQLAFDATSPPSWAP